MSDISILNFTDENLKNKTIPVLQSWSEKGFLKISLLSKNLIMTAMNTNHMNVLMVNIFKLKTLKEGSSQFSTKQ